MVIGHMKTIKQFTFFLGGGATLMSPFVFFFMEEDKLAFELLEEVEIEVESPSTRLCKKHLIKLNVA